MTREPVIDPYICRCGENVYTLSVSKKMFALQHGENPEHRSRPMREGKCISMRSDSGFVFYELPWLRAIHKRMGISPT